MVRHININFKMCVCVPVLPSPYNWHRKYEILGIRIACTFPMTPMSAYFLEFSRYQPAIIIPESASLADLTVTDSTPAESGSWTQTMASQGIEWSWARRERCVIIHFILPNTERTWRREVVNGYWPTMEDGALLSLRCCGTSWERCRGGLTVNRVLLQVAIYLECRLQKGKVSFNLFWTPVVESCLKHFLSSLLKTFQSI